MSILGICRGNVSQSLISPPPKPSKLSSVLRLAVEGIVFSSCSCVRSSIRAWSYTKSFRTRPLTHRFWEVHQMYNLGVVRTNMNWIDFEFKRSKITVTSGTVAFKYCEKDTLFKFVNCERHALKRQGHKRSQTTFPAKAYRSTICRWGSSTEVVRHRYVGRL